MHVMSDIVCLSVLCVCMSSFACVSICMIVYLFVCLSVCKSICLSVCLSVALVQHNSRNFCVCFCVCTKALVLSTMDGMHNVGRGLHYMFCLCLCWFSKCILFHILYCVHVVLFFFRQRNLCKQKRQQSGQLHCNNCVVAFCSLNSCSCCLVCPLLFMLCSVCLPSLMQ